MGKFDIDDLERRFHQFAKNSLRKRARVVDFGRGQSFGEKQIQSYEITPPSETTILSMDIRPETRPIIVGDLANLPLVANSVGMAFCESVLEHVVPISNLKCCIAEIHRVLVDGGMVAGWVPFCFHYHGGEKFPDGTRFTYDGIERLLAEFSDVTIQPCGGPISVFLDALGELGYTMRRAGVEHIETKIRYFLLDETSGILRHWDRFHGHKRRMNSVGFRFFAVK